MAKSCSRCRCNNAGRPPPPALASTWCAWPTTAGMPEIDRDPAGTPAGGIRRDGTVLGFDVGTRRIGVAVGSAFGHGARALAVVDVHGQRPDWAAIDRLQKEWRPDGFIVGDPMTLDG